MVRQVRMVWVVCLERSVRLVRLQRGFWSVRMERNLCVER